MPSPKRRGRPASRMLSRSEYLWSILGSPRGQGLLLGVLITVITLYFCGALGGQTLQRESRPPAALFIAIGSAPGHTLLRQAARDAWLRWLPDDGTVDYRFFSDAPPATPGEDDSHSDIDWQALLTEAARFKDLVLQPMATGYGTTESNLYGLRARYQIDWAFKNTRFGFNYFLRVDDDSFLCLHRLLYELKSAPRQQFFWGRYWCRAGRHRADENFMLFSEDVARLLNEDDVVGKIIPFDDRVTLGWNFGYWSWIFNLTIFDDQTRIDAQQGYLTEYMHKEEASDASRLSDFCESFIYAHHVHAPLIRAAYHATITRLMYPIPRLTSPWETCEMRTVSFLPRRHSDRLPNIRLSVADQR